MGGWGSSEANAPVRNALGHRRLCPSHPSSTQLYCLSLSSAAVYQEGMKVLLASPRGFCAGVNMAIESLDLALASLEPPIYVYHEIVHNKYVVEHFRERGVTFVDTLDEVPLGS